jgi:hypothetical protein
VIMVSNLILKVLFLCGYIGLHFQDCLRRIAVFSDGSNQRDPWFRLVINISSWTILRCCLYSFQCFELFGRSWNVYELQLLCPTREQYFVWLDFWSLFCNLLCNNNKY